MTDFSGNLGTTTPDDVAISADGSLIFAAGTWTSPSSPVPVNDGDLRIYNAATGALVNTLPSGHASARSTFRLMEASSW